MFAAGRRPIKVWVAVPVDEEAQHIVARMVELRALANSPWMMNCCRFSRERCSFFAREELEEPQNRSDRDVQIAVVKIGHRQ
jgi:hypothetical protein